MVFFFFSLSEKQKNWLKLFYFKSVARTITSIVLLPPVRSIGLRKHSCGATPKKYRAPGLFSCSKALLDDGFLSWICFYSLSSFYSPNFWTQRGGSVYLVKCITLVAAAFISSAPTVQKRANVTLLWFDFSALFWLQCNPLCPPPCQDKRCHFNPFFVPLSRCDQIKIKLDCSGIPLFEESSHLPPYASLTHAHTYMYTLLPAASSQ